MSLLLWGGGSARCQEDEGPDGDGALRLAVRAAIDRVAPSVVRIELLGGMDRVDGVRTTDGPVSGLVVREDGHILSAAVHFERRPTSILVRLPDGERRPATVVATDRNRMLTLLKVEADMTLPVPMFASKESVRVGQWAIGMGRVHSPERPNVSVGIISAKDRIWGKALQTDAAVSPANYGGPLVDLHGRVVGLIVPLSPDEQSPSAGLDWYDSGIGFAIPADDFLAVVPNLQEGKDLWPGRSGIRLSPQTIHVGEPIVASLHPASPAEGAGIRPRDRIVAVDGAPVRRGADVLTALGPRYAGHRVQFQLQRGDDPITAEVTLTDKLLPFAHGFLGVLPRRDVLDADGATMPDSAQGVAVRYVYPDSPASKAGLVAGDRIVSLDGVAMADAATLRGRIGRAGPGATVQLHWIGEGGAKQASVDLASLPEAIPVGVPPGLPNDATAVVASETQAVSVPGFNNKALLYRPTSRASTPLGLMLWLHAPGQRDHEEILRRWQPLCDRYGLLLLMPQTLSDDLWQPSDIDYVTQLAARVCRDHPVDPTRIVLYGQLAGGSVAYLVVGHAGEWIRGIATVDSPLVGRIPENTPEIRLALFLAHSASPPGARVAGAVAPLRSAHYPVTVLELGETPRSLTDQESRLLAAWIDTLDRI